MKWNNYGESSLTLLVVHCGINKADPRVPCDPQDFVRCIHLCHCLYLNVIEAQNLISLAAKMYPIWKPFADNWEKLISVYGKEKHQEEAPELYKLLAKLNKEAQK